MNEVHYTERASGGETLPEVSRPANAPVFAVTEFPLPDRRRVYLANGVIGLRLPAVPFLGADVAVSGLVGRSVADGMESAAPAPYPCQADIVVGHDRLSERPDLVTVREQRLDMAWGELETRLEFRTREATLAIVVLTFVPRTLPTAICQEIVITSDRDCELQLEAMIDPRGLPGRCRERRMTQSKADAVLWWETRDALASVGAAFEATLTGGELLSSRQNDWGNESELCLRVVRVKIKANEPVTLRQLGALVPSILHTEPHWQALRMVAYAAYQGFDWLRSANRRAWAALWPSCPKVTAAVPDIDRVVASAFFYVHASVQPCTPGSLPPFGLSRTEGYYNGHVFIDHEAIMFPPLLLTAPDAARATLDYRTRRLHLARMNALCQGTRGIMFPWQSGVHGDEVSRPHATGCVMEFATPDIAQAFLLYADATGDELFLREDAWPVVRGAAEWICSRVVDTARGCEVRNLTARESFANTHNDPEVNRKLAELLRQAVDLAGRLGLPAPARWRMVADRMLILTDPADLARETAAGSHVHTRMSVREVANFPISSWIAVGQATREGRLAEAAERVAAAIDAHWQPDFGAWREYGQHWNLGVFDMDCFLTNPGALLRLLLVEFPGLKIGLGAVESWAAEPVALPEGWDAIEVERVWARGEPWRLTARQGAERAELEAAK
jgi:trehalose/maltose hydrolase-like predicted phosphorylase